MSLWDRLRDTLGNLFGGGGQREPPPPPPGRPPPEPPPPPPPSYEPEDYDDDDDDFRNEGEYVLIDGDVVFWDDSERYLPDQIREGGLGYPIYEDALNYARPAIPEGVYYIVKRRSDGFYQVIVTGSP